MSGKLQHEDFKSLSDLTAAGATAASLLNDSKIYVTANGLNQQLSSAITSGLIGGGSGGLGNNYIKNVSGTYNLSGATTFGNGAAVPTTGTGGSPTLTLATTTTNPIVTAGNYLITPGALGDGVNFAFTINPGDQSKTFQISGDYFFGTPASAHDGDYSLFIRDNTNGLLIYPSTVKLLAKVGYGSPFKVTFQTASNSTSYSLLIVQTVASASTTPIQLANLYVGPQVTSIGPAMTDWVPYPAVTTGFGTVTGAFFKSRRVGDSLEVSGYFITGTTSGVLAKVSLGYNGTNGNVSIDTSKIVSGTTNELVGYASVNLNGAFSLSTLAYNGDTANLFFGDQYSGASSLSACFGNTITGAGAGFSFFAKVPIVGWSSNSVMSSDYDSRVIAASYQNNSLSGAVPTSATVVNFPTANFDTAGMAQNISSSFSYVIPSSGIYSADGQVGFSASSAGTVYLQFYKNGTFLCQAGLPTGGGFGSLTLPIFADFQAKAGDVITLDVFANNTAFTYSTQATAYFKIKKIQGPTQVAASETINAVYHSTAGQSIASGGATQLSFATKMIDDHGIWNGNTLQVPVSGNYNINLQALYPSNTSGVRQVYIYKNGTAIATGFDSAASGFSAARLNYTARLLPSDLVTFYTSQNSGSTLALSADPTSTFFSVQKVGN